MVGWDQIREAGMASAETGDTGSPARPFRRARPACPEARSCGRRGRPDPNRDRIVIASCPSFEVIPGFAYAQNPEAPPLNQIFSLTLISPMIYICLHEQVKAHLLVVRRSQDATVLGASPSRSGNVAREASRRCRACFTARKSHALSLRGLS